VKKITLINILCSVNFQAMCSVAKSTPPYYIPLGFILFGVNCMQPYHPFQQTTGNSLRCCNSHSSEAHNADATYTTGSAANSCCPSHVHVQWLNMFYILITDDMNYTLLIS
jgi:hypothetical protein